MIKKLSVLRGCCLCFCLLVSTVQGAEEAVNIGLLDKFFETEKLTQSDAVLVVDEQDNIIYQWRPDESMVPASLLKLVTAYLAIKKWGLEHTFYTDFYRVDDQLWIKGYGDPYLVSEELDRLASQLTLLDVSWVNSIHIDSSYFVNEKAPGRSQVDDPYNAPLSAVAANFNTVMLQKVNGSIKSAESQTPLTPLVVELARSVKGWSTKPKRINLVNGVNAQRNTGQILLAKLGLTSSPILVEQVLPEGALLFHRYQNSHAVDDIVRGMLKYSNNFMANQLFLSLADDLEKENALTKRVSFSSASDYAQQSLSDAFSWQEHQIVEGSGLSRENRLTALQVNDLLKALEPNKQLFKKVKHSHADIRAKTGTLDGVRSYAGYIDFPKKSYRFVFNFSRQVPWQYREKLLIRLVTQLHKSGAK